MRFLPGTGRRALMSPRLRGTAASSHSRAGARSYRTGTSRWEVGSGGRVSIQGLVARGAEEGASLSRRQAHEATASAPRVSSASPRPISPDLAKSRILSWTLAVSSVPVPVYRESVRAAMPLVAAGAAPSQPAPTVLPHERQR